ncbi:MAG TPA: S41 family peptidase [Azospirillaceae bacterium]|nr:S41 family peptidase [Azospirillaceae bacterium]
MLKTLLLGTALAALLAGANPVAASEAAFDRKAWLDDFAALKAGMERQYANLTWAASPGSGIDVPALERAARDELEVATSEEQAVAALRRFLEGFKDGHVGLGGRRSAGTGGSGGSAPAPVPTGAGAAEACAAMGFGRSESPDFSLPIEAAAPAELLVDGGEAQPFRTVLLTLPDGRRVGAVRIPIFIPATYPAGCHEEWEAVRAALPPEGCDERCRSDIRRRAEIRLTAHFAKRLAALREKGAEILVIDIGGNGGGSEWAEVVARAVTNRPVPGTPLALVRHAHFHPLGDSMLAEVEKALAAPGLRPVARPYVEAIRAETLAFRTALRAGPGCDMGWVWREKRPWEPRRAEGCSNIVAGPVHTTGSVAWLERGALGSRTAEEALFGPADESRQGEGWDGPVLIHMDGNSASAAEQFAAVLKGAGVARLAGSRTYGSGCGHINGRIRLILPNSGYSVGLPNCARLLPDGRNEVSGLAPDIPLPDEESARAAALLRAATLPGG